MQMHPESVGIVGCGLIGSSIGRALAGKVPQRIAVELPGWPTDPAIIGTIVDAAMPVSDALKRIDVLILALPVDTIVTFIGTYSSVIAPGTLVMDVGSVKRPVIDAYDHVDRRDIHMIGGHPICGSEQSGHLASRADLFDSAPWVLVPASWTSDAAHARAAHVVRLLGSHPVELDAGTHDRIAACTSHLVRLLGGALAQTVASLDADTSHVGDMVGGGLRHATRLARGDTQMWTSILAANADHVVDAARAFAAHLDNAITAVASADPATIEAWVQSSREAARTVR